MIHGIGTDIIEVNRIEKNLEKVSGLKTKLFTAKEIKYCETKRHSAEHFAARFAAKEAFFKALGTGWRYGFAFTEIEIINNELGKPEITVSGKIEKYITENNISNIHISISHLKDIANAVVILEIINK